jgi:hypothetical protein
MRIGIVGANSADSAESSAAPFEDRELRSERYPAPARRAAPGGGALRAVIRGVVAWLFDGFVEALAVLGGAVPSSLSRSAADDAVSADDAVTADEAVTVDDAVTADDALAQARAAAPPRLALVRGRLRPPLRPIPAGAAESHRVRPVAKWEMGPLPPLWVPGTIDATPRTGPAPRALDVAATVARTSPCDSSRKGSHGEP